MSTTASAKARKPTWQPMQPPPPSPKILNLPRRTRRKQPKTATKNRPTSTAKAHISHHHYDPLEFHQRHYFYNNKGNLESLFGQEREFTRSDGVPIVLLNSSASLSPSSTSSFSRRERVEDDEGRIVVAELRDEIGGGCGGFEVENWKFQADILRAECNFLRMEREFALKKLERNRKQMEKTLRSAVHTLLNGREKVFEGKNVTAVLKEEIGDLAENLKKLEKSSRAKGVVDIRNGNNFDKEACRLQQQLEKLGGLSDEKSLVEKQEIAESSLSTVLNHDVENTSHASGHKSENKSTDNVQVELLTRKMEGISKGMLDRMEEEYGSLVSTTANSSVASSASTSKRTECSDFSAFLSRHLYKEQMPSEESKCSGRCKALVRRIVEQVKAETEQWSQMQEMLGQVREEMAELQASRDFWEERAVKSNCEIEVLQSSVKEWKEKAFNFEAKANELETELSKLKADLESSRVESRKPNNLVNLGSLGKHLEKENCVIRSNLKVKHQNDNLQLQGDTMNDALDSEAKPTKDLPPLTLGNQLAKEKLLLLNRLKGNRRNNTEEGCKQEPSPDGRRKAHACTYGIAAQKRLPLRDIVNSSPLPKQSTKAAVFPLHSPKHSKTGEAF